MNVEALTGLLNHLHLRNQTVPCPPELLGSIHHVDFVYSGRLVDELVSVLLVMRPKQYNDILLGAINGNLVDIAAVAGMYACGFGLPQDDSKAVAWAAFATLDPDDRVTYAEAVLALKADRKVVIETCMAEGMIVPETVNRIAAKLASSYHSKPYTGQTLGKGVRVVPALPGVKVTLIYRNLEVKGVMQTKLYGVLFPEHPKLAFSRELHTHFDVPVSLGEIRGNNTIPEYKLFGKTVKLYCVQGTLTTPRSKIAERDALFPSCTTVRALMEAVTSGAVPSDAAVLKSCAAEVVAGLAAKAKKQAALLKALTSANKPKKLEIAACERKLARTVNRQTDAAYIAEEATKRAVPLQAKTYLQFVATEMFVCGRNGVLKNAPLGKETEVHLQSLGFRSFTHAALELIKYTGAKNVVLGKSELDNVIDTFNKAYDGEHRITSVRIRPSSDSVNIHKSYSYKRSKETTK